MSWFSDTLEDVDAWLGGGDDSGGGTNWDIDSAAIDYSVDEERQNFMNMGEFGDMGVDMSASSINPTYQESLYEESGGDFYFEPEYDNRSYAKQAQDWIYRNLGVDKETAKLIAGFTGAAGKALEGRGGGDGGGGSGGLKRPSLPKGSQGGTSQLAKARTARAMQLAGLSQRARAAMTTMQKNQNQFGSATNIADLIDAGGSTNTKPRTIANPRGLRDLNIKTNQYV